MRRPPTLLAIAACLTAAPVAAQRGGVPADTFADAGARALVLDAHAFRDAAAAGLRSYETRVTERVHIGIAITRRMPGRGRTLYHREQVAIARWQSDGDDTVLWLGRRTGSPTMGRDWGTDPPFGMDFDIVDELDLEDIGVDILFDPLGDRLDVFDADFIQPVSSAGLARYRFASGDTMQIRLPAPDRTITLVEVVVRPREEAWETVEGSLWFDRETGVLVRAAYRPSGVWDQEVREPGDLDDVPGFLKPAIGTVHSIVIEYGLYDQRWWLPRRIFAEGTFDWGNGLVRMPLTIEWSMTGHVVNEAASATLTDPALVGLGRRIRGDDRRRDRIAYLARPGIDLATSPDLPPPLADGEPIAFTREELRPLVDRMERITGPEPAPPPVPLDRMLLTSLRYDRVRGLNAAWSAPFVAGPIRITPHLRAATAIPDVEATLTARFGALSASVYRRVDDASDWNHADGLGNSLGTLLLGWDGGDYFRAAGGALDIGGARPTVRAAVSIFAEAQRPIGRQTSISLARIRKDSLRANIDADRLEAFGLRASLGGQLGSDTERGILDWTLDGEAATGDFDWARGHASLTLTGPLARRFTGALQARGGLAAKGSPIQRQFLLGGVGTLRGVRENAIAGRAFWLVRAELGRGLPGLRANAFVDLGWAGNPADPGPATGGAGLGASFLDGLFRVDLARGFADAAAWRLYLYLDALL